MPLPLAHPAAVLPLRRFCPQYLSFSALVFGSVVPDVAYAFNVHRSFPKIVTAVFGLSGRNLFAEQGIRNWDGLSHSLVGSIVFCLPLGLLLHAAFRYVRAPLIATLPNPHRAVLVPLCQQGRHSWWVYSISLLIGVWLHLLWDSLAKDDWWLAKNWTLLQLPVVETGSSSIELNQIIWIVSSVGGTIALMVAYISFLKQKRRDFWCSDRKEMPYYFLWMTVVGISGLVATFLSLRYIGFGASARMLFHLFHTFYGVFLTTFGMCVMAIALVAVMRMKQAEAVPVMKEKS